MDLSCNKRLGNAFEREYAEILRKRGYWVTLLTPKQHIGSQPADLIAIKDNIPMLVDCKTCKTQLFPLSRIEENQRQAFKRYVKCGNANYILAIKYKNRIYEIDMKQINFTQKNVDLEGGNFENYCIESYKSTRTR